MELHVAREWKVEVPHRGTTEWNELVALLFDRQDIADDFWTVKMVASALVAETELSGKCEYPGYRYLQDDGTVATKVLATARPIATESESVFDPRIYRITLDELDLPRLSERLPIIPRIQERLSALKNAVRILPDGTTFDEELQVEAILRGLIDDVADFTTERYGS